MVSLGNQARLLAAQAFNKQVLERKARERQAKIEAERREDLAKITRRKREAVANARNVVERQRAQEALNEQLQSRQARELTAKINAKAKRETARAFTRVAKGSNIGVLTGFEAQKDSRGRAIGISKRESKTRKNTKALLRKEIARQQKIAREGTDLERFLKNERAISAGQVSSAELKKQIAQRKARGLSQTPAQKRASQFFRDKELSDALDARAKRKGRPKLRATFGTVLSERARAGGLGSTPFADPLFVGGGRSKEAIIGRGGTFGRRQAGESISSQLSFISSAKARSTSARIGFAQGLLSNLNFEGSSQSSLLNIVGNKKIRTPKTFQQELRSGVGFFTTIQAPVTKPKLTKQARGQLVARRKAEDFAKTEKARKTIARQARQTTQPVFDLEGFGRGLDAFNLNLGRSIEQQNVVRRRDSPRFSLAPPSVTVQRQQAQAPTQISLVERRKLTTKQKVALKRSEAKAKRAQAQAVTDENRALREAGLLGFASPTLVRATGRPSETRTFGVTPAPAPSGNIFNVSLSENLGINDALGVTPKRTTTRARRPSPTPTPRDDFGSFGGLDIGGLISFDAVPRPAQERPTEEFDFSFGLREAVQGTVRRAGSSARESVSDFFGFDAGAGFGSESLGASFGFGEAVSEAVPLLDTGFDFLR